MVKKFEKKINAIHEIMTRRKKMKINRMKEKKKNMFENVKNNKLRDFPDIFKTDFKEVETKLFEFESSFLSFNMFLIFLVLVLFIYLLYNKLI